MNNFVTDLRNALLQPPNGGAARRRNRRRRRPRGSVNTVPVVVAPPPVVPAPRRRNRRRANSRRVSGNSVAADGILRLSKLELLGTVRTGADGKASDWFRLIPDSLPLLKVMGRVFERIRWHSVTITYRPAVGTTQGGLVTVGVDWDSIQAAATRVKVSGYSPSMTVPIWDPSARPMVLPASRLNAKLWYLPNATDPGEQAPATIAYAADGPPSTTVGEFWIHYSVTLMGTRPE